MSPEGMVIALATALVHFLWQGVAVAALLALVTWTLGSARARYAAGCAAMALMVVSFVVTAWLAYPVEAESRVTLPEVVPDLSAMPFVAGSPRIPAEAWIVAAWALGALVMSTRIAVGWLRLRWLASRALPELDLQRLVDALAARMGIWRPVKVLRTATGVPMVVGWLRPVMMLPASAVTGLSASQLEAVIVHELAHVGRLDFLVNVAQSLVEAFFFFHPAVWWISGRVRTWREHCCDDRAVAETGDAIAYARALTALETTRQPATAVSLGGGSLLERVQRLVRGQTRRTQTPRTGPRRTSARMLVAAVLAVGGAGVAVAAASACVGQSDKLETMAIDVGSPHFDAAAGEPTLAIEWLPPSVSRFGPLFLSAARRHGVDPEMLAIVTLVESGGWIGAESPSGARGLMQIMPATGEGIAKDRGVARYDLDDPAFNIDFGAWYLARQLETFSTGDGAETVERVAAAYNGGPNRLRKHLEGDADLSDETTRYKRWVKQLWMERKQSESETFREWLAAGGERLVARAMTEMDTEARQVRP